MNQMDEKNDQQNSDSKRIEIFFQKALDANSAREKNTFLNELKKLLKKHSVDYSLAITERERIDSEIIKAKALNDKINKEYTELQNSVSFLTELDFYQAAPDVSSMEKLIKRIERDISEISTLPNKDKLQEIISSSKSEKHLYLDLLNFREVRLKQLVEAFKQKILISEQRLECASIVIDEFGSITNMINKFQQLQKENEKLKVRQIRFSHESLLKLRRFTKCEPKTLHTFFIALQNELSVLCDEINKMQKQSEENILNFTDETENIELILTKPMFSFSEPLPNLIEKPIEFNETIIESLNQNINNKTYPTDYQLINLDNQYSIIKEKTQRLRSELTLRRNSEKILTEIENQRFEKLHSLHERLLTEVHSLQEQNETTNNSKQVLNEMLEQITNEYKQINDKSINLSQKCQELYKIHCRNRKEFQKIWKSGSCIFKLTELLSKSYLYQTVDKTEILPNLILKDKEQNRKIPNFTETPHPLLSNLYENVHLELVKRNALDLIQKDKGKKIDKLKEICSTFQEDKEIQNITNYISKSPKQIQDNLQDKKYIERFFKELLQGIREYTTKDINAFNDYLKENIKFMKDVSEPILCKVKRVTSSQTFQARKSDIETQYNKLDIIRGRKRK